MASCEDVIIIPFEQDIINYLQPSLISKPKNERMKSLIFFCSVHESIRRNDSTVDKLVISWPFRGKPDIRLSYTCDCTRVPLT